jgi:hypothetical protein
MSIQSRKEYYNILQRRYKNDEIPIIVSHGAVNGMISDDQRFVQIEDSFRKFNPLDINIFDFEIVKICETNGFLGIQPDSRRIASVNMLTKAKTKYDKVIKNWLYRKFRWKRYIKETRKKMAELVWNQILHIALVLDKNNLPAWGTATLGSDYEGGIKPLEGFWTAKDFPLLKKFLKKHAKAFMKKKPSDEWVCPRNGTISHKEIVDKFMYKNAKRFLEKYHKEKRI